MLSGQQLCWIEFAASFPQTGNESTSGECCWSSSFLQDLLEQGTLQQQNLHFDFQFLPSSKSDNAAIVTINCMVWPSIPGWSHLEMIKTSLQSVLWISRLNPVVAPGKTHSFPKADPRGEADVSQGLLAGKMYQCKGCTCTLLSH